MNESNRNEVNEKWNDKGEKEKWKMKGIKEINGNEKRCGEILRWNENEYDERIKMKKGKEYRNDNTGDKNVIG